MDETTQVPQDDVIASTDEETMTPSETTEEEVVEEMPAESTDEAAA
jgi:hypothetical protein